MLQKFALAVKTKTIEFFADDAAGDEADDEDFPPLPVDPAPEAIITGQRVVVLKPDLLPPSNSNPSPPPPLHAGTLVSAVFATLSSFQAAYLHLQTAHSPLLPSALRAADAAAVSHLSRLSDLKRLHSSLTAAAQPISSFLEAQVRENQSLLRAFDAVVNRLQAGIDRRDAEAAELRQRLRDAEAANAKLAARLDRACAPPPGENIEALLSVGVFDSVLRDACRITHRFARAATELMKRNGWDLGLVAESISPGVNYHKPGHCRYAILSHICLLMFGGFDSFSFGCEGSRAEGPDAMEVSDRRNDSLRKFIEHTAGDPFELINMNPNCDFAQFCERKYHQLIRLGSEPTLFQKSYDGESPWELLRPSSPLHEPFVAMASSLWMLHRLAWAYDPVVKIFQVSRGAEFSAVYMESIIRRTVREGPGRGKTPRPKVGFTVVPGFRVGGTVIQCRVYLDHSKQTP